MFLFACHMPRNEVDHDRDFVASRGDIADAWDVPSELGPLPRRVPLERRVSRPLKGADEEYRPRVSQAASDVGVVATGAARQGRAASSSGDSADDRSVIQSLPSVLASDRHESQDFLDQIAEARERVVVIKTTTWVARISKRYADEPLGLKVAIDLGKKLSVQHMPERPGPAWRYGEENPKLAMRPGDMIPEVNGTRGAAALILDVMQHTKELTIRVVRNVKFVVSFSGVRDLGLRCRAVGKHLVVQSIREDSDVAEANAWALAGSQICPGDIIERINGLPGIPSELLERLAHATGEVDLSIRRPAPAGVR